MNKHQSKGDILTGHHAPIQIQAQILREERFRAPFGSALGFVAIPDDALSSSSQDKARFTKPWPDSEVKRAIAASEEAGLRNYRVEVAPDRTISIVVGAP